MIPAKFLSKIGIHELEIEGVKVKATHVTDNTSVIDNKIEQLRASLNKQRPVVGIDVKVTAVDQKRLSNLTSNDLLIICGGNCCLVIKLANLTTFPSSILDLLADKNICFVGFRIYGKVGSSNLIIPNVGMFSLSSVAEVGQLAARVLKKPNLSKCGLEELDKEVRNTTAVAAASPDQTACPLQDSQATVDLFVVFGVVVFGVVWCVVWSAVVFVCLVCRVLKKPNLSKCGLEELDKEVRKTVTDSKANVATSLPGTRAGASACPDWKAMVFTDEEIKYAIHDAYTSCVISDKLLGILDAVN